MDFIVSQNRLHHTQQLALGSVECRARSLSHPRYLSHRSCRPRGVRLNHVDLSRPAAEPPLPLSAFLRICGYASVPQHGHQGCLERFYFQDLSHRVEIFEASGVA